MIEFFVVGLVLSLCAALCSPILVSKQMSNLSNGMAHATLGGLALALFILPGIELSIAHQLIAIGFVSLCSFIIAKKGTRDQDSSIAVLFAGAMALGPFLNSFNPQKFDFSTYLFGNLLLTSYKDLFLMGPILILCLILAFVFKKYIINWIFDDHYLFFIRPNSKLIPYVFLLICSLVIVLTTKISGIILMTTMLVVPGMMSLRFSLPYIQTLVISLLIGILSYILGFMMSYHWDIPIGSTIALIQVILYFIPIHKVKITRI